MLTFKKCRLRDVRMHGLSHYNTLATFFYICANKKTNACNRLPTFIILEFW